MAKWTYAYGDGRTGDLSKLRLWGRLRYRIRCYIARKRGK